MTTKNFPFYSTLCQVCLKSTDIKRCSICKTMPYCSQDHQRQDWPSHRKLCKAIALSNSKIAYKVESMSDLIHYKVSLKYAWEFSLERKLTTYESSIYLNLRNCRICYKRDCDFDCSDCLCVSYCSELHKEQDKGHDCGALKLCRLTDFKSIPIDYDFFELVDNNNDIPNDIQDFIDKTNFKTCDVVERALAGHLLSFFGTIFYAFEKLQNVKNDMCVHIVGAAEQESLQRWDQIGHFLNGYYPQIERISLIFIGPEAAFHEPIEIVHGRTAINLSVIKEVYHDANVGVADMVVIFNGGLHECVLSWRPSVARMLESAVVLTGYLEEEVLHDRKILLKYAENEIDVVQDCICNPFASTKPFRSWDCASKLVYYCNNYIFIYKNK